VRLDPLIPHINDAPKEIDKMVKRFTEAGALQVISSTYKAKPDNFRRVAGVFKNKAEELRKIYYEDNEMVRGIRYAPRELRFKILKRVRDATKKYGLEFSVCREGLALNTAKTCDGSHHLIKKR
jgi:DNA repair photolyase